MSTTAKPETAEQAWALLTAATQAEARARAAYNQLEESTNPDREALRAASEALGDAVATEDAAQALYQALAAAEE